MSLALAALVAAGGVGWWTLGRRGADAVLPIPGERDRVSVEVLNASGVDGFARDVTRQLRRRGLDVVYFGTARFDTLSITRILVRRGDSTGARRVREALGAGEIAIEPDSGLLLDVSVLLGRDLPTALHFDP